MGLIDEKPVAGKSRATVTLRFLPTHKAQIDVVLTKLDIYVKSHKIPDPAIPILLFKAINCPPVGNRDFLMASNII
jgi:hypothetical protein